MIFRDEETYQLFDDAKSNPAGQEFEFKDSYWAEMEGILDQHDAKKKRRKGLLFFMSSTAVAAILTFWFVSFNSGERPLTAGSTSVASLNEGPQKVSEKVVYSDSKNEDLAQRKDIPTEKEDLLSTESKVVNSSNSHKKQETLIANTSAKKKNLILVSLKENSISENTVAEATTNGNLIKMDPFSDVFIENSIANLSIELEKRKAKFQLKHSLFANVEAGIVNKYQPKNGVSYAVTAGMGYELAFHKNLAFVTGFNLIYRDGLAQTYTNETRQYGFNSTRYFQDIHYKGQFNIELPISLKVKMRRSSISAGVGASFLVAVRSSVSQFKPEASSIESLNNNWGIKEGIRKMDVTLNLQYAYAIKPNIELTAGMSAGLLDQTDNAFFSNGAKNHNLQFRLGLKYHFFNK